MRQGEKHTYKISVAVQNEKPVAILNEKQPLERLKDLRKY
jgi:hypothetical protein